MVDWFFAASVMITEWLLRVDSKSEEQTFEGLDSNLFFLALN